MPRTVTIETRICARPMHKEVHQVHLTTPPPTSPHHLTDHIADRRTSNLPAPSRRATCTPHHLATCIADSTITSAPTASTPNHLTGYHITDHLIEEYSIHAAAATPQRRADAHSCRREIKYREELRPCFSEEGFVLISKQNWTHTQTHNHLNRVISMMAFIKDHT